MIKKSMLLLLTLATVSACGTKPSSEPITSELDESVYEGYERVVGWPNTNIAAFLSEFDITDSVPAHTFAGSYWHAENDHPLLGRFYEVFNKEPESELSTYVDVLTAANWEVEDLTDEEGPYFSAINGAETIQLEIYYYYEDEDGYPDSITWIVVPLVEEIDPELPGDGEYETSTSWPGTALKDFLTLYEVTDNVPTQTYSGTYWYGEFEDEYGPYFEVYNEQPKAGVETYKGLLTAAGWEIEDYSDENPDGPYYVAYNASETLAIDVFYYAGDEYYPAGITWYFAPLAGEGEPGTGEVPTGESVKITFAEAKAIRSVITGGFKWTTASGFTLTHTTGASDNAAADYPELRLYRLNELEFNAPTGYTITAIVFLADGAKNGPVLGDATVVGGTIVASGTTYTLNATPGVSTVKITAGDGAQTRILSVEIFFAAK